MAGGTHIVRLIGAICAFASLAGMPQALAAQSLPVTATQAASVPAIGSLQLNWRPDARIANERRVTIRPMPQPIAQPVSSPVKADRDDWVPPPVIDMRATPSLRWVRDKPDEQMVALVPMPVPPRTQ